MLSQFVIKAIYFTLVVVLLLPSLVAAVINNSRRSDQPLRSAGRAAADLGHRLRHFPCPFWPWPIPSDAPSPCLGSVHAFVCSCIVVCRDAIPVLCSSVMKPAVTSNQSLEPTAGRRTERLREEL